MNAVLRRPMVADMLTVLLAALLSVLCGLSILVGLRAVAGIAAAALLVCAAASTRARFVFFVFGGMWVFQNSSDVLTTKIADVLTIKTAYVIGALVVIAISIARITRNSRIVRNPHLNVMLGASAVFAAILATSSIVAVGSGTQPIAWFRDAFPYVMLASAPVLAIDAASAFQAKSLRVILATLGAIAAVSFLMSWLTRRGFGASSFDRTFLPSFVLCGAATSFAVVRWLDEPRKGAIGWFLLACMIPTMVLMTGTRSGLLFLLIPFVALLIASRLTGLQRIGLAVAGSIAAAAVVILIAAILVPVFKIDQSDVQSRLSGIPGLSEQDGAKQSLEERSAQRTAAQTVWRNNVFMGTGPGYEFQWLSASGTAKSSFTIDASVSFAAKFGALGVAILAFWLASITLFVHSGRRRGAFQSSQALVVYAVFLVGFAFLASPLEDKGLAFALIVLLAMVVAESNVVPSFQPGPTAPRRNSLQRSPLIMNPHA